MSRKSLMKTIHLGDKDQKVQVYYSLQNLRWRWEDEPYRDVYIDEIVVLGKGIYRNEPLRMSRKQDVAFFDQWRDQIYERL